MDLSEFRDEGHGAVIQLVGEKRLYTSKDDFLASCLAEFDYHFEGKEPEDLPTVTEVHEGFCRQEFVCLYEFCSPCQGAFEVFYIDLT